MEKAEISRMINSFNAIKGYFDSTRKYMPQIAKLVTFIEDIVPLLNNIHSDLHQSSSLIPKASEKLEKVTSATELATTEVMDIVDAVIARLGRMTESLDSIEETVADDKREAVTAIRTEIEGSQDDLFSIMNALQFQDITTQQINAIGQDIDTVHIKLNDLLKGFQEDGITLSKVKEVAFDPNAEFDFSRAADSQKVADELLKNDVNDDAAPDSDGQVNASSGSDSMVMGPDGQPDISAMMKKMHPEDQEQ